MSKDSGRLSSVDSPFPIGNINRLLVRVAGFFVGEDNVGGNADVVGGLRWIYLGIVGEIGAIVKDLKPKS